MLPGCCFSKGHFSGCGFIFQNITTIASQDNLIPKDEINGICLIDLVKRCPLK